MVVRSVDAVFAGQANRIHEAVSLHSDLTGMRGPEGKATVLGLLDRPLQKPQDSPQLKRACEIIFLAPVGHRH